MLDLLSGLLQDVRPRGAVFDRSFMRPPWSLRFDERAPLTMVALLHGDGWLRAEGEQPVRLDAGVVAVVVGPTSYTISDQPDAKPNIVIHSAERCTTPDGRILEDGPELCSDIPIDADGSSVLLKGTYQVEGSVCERVLRGLPRVLVVPSNARAHETMGMIVAELADPRAGRQAVVERLLDLLLISTLREWLDEPGSQPPPWYRAQTDPVVGPALRAIHDDPAHPWTVGALAEHVTVSRATFARRFSELVGEPPMSYVTCWRLCLAADLLRQTDASVGDIARQVGYANAYALSVAFKRVYGIRPTDHRRHGGALGAPASSASA
jgi:AraC-like DNA-binding protein